MVALLANWKPKLNPTCVICVFCCGRRSNRTVDGVACLLPGHGTETGAGEIRNNLGYLSTGHVVHVSAYGG